MQMKSSYFLLAWFLLYCYGSIFLIRTWFVPDEYWQSMEISHRVVFNYGYVTWEWGRGIRSSAYALFIAKQYWILKFLHLDTAFSVIYFPRFVQATLSAVGLLYTCRLSSQLYGSKTVPWTALSLSLSWFLFYCCSRTLYNTIELVVTVVGLFYYPWKVSDSPKRNRNDWLYIFMAGLSVLIRPTSAITWIPLFVWHVVGESRQGLTNLLMKCVVLGISFCVLQVCMDYIVYGKLVFTPYEFVKFNAVSGLSSFYGTHPWHWYVTQGVPVILTSHLVPLLYEVWRKPKDPLLMLIVWIVGVYSMLEHKEFRFIFSIVPLAACIVGRHLSWLSEKRQTVRNAFVILLCVTNIPMALYLGLVHQRGTLDVMHFLRDQHRSDSDMSVLFLMPCHSTPFYSHVHRNITMTFLTCEPPIFDDQQFTKDYVDEADVFYSNPKRWLTTYFLTFSWTSHMNKLSDVNKVVNGKMGSDAGRDRMLLLPPSHIVMFDSLQEEVSDMLESLSYGRCARFFHSHFPEGRRGKSVVVYCRH